MLEVIDAGKHLAYENRPELEPEWEWVWNLYEFVSDSRPEGMNEVARIPLVEIVTALDLHEYDDPAQRLFATKMLRAMDDEYRTFVKGRRAPPPKVAKPA